MDFSSSLDDIIKSKRRLPARDRHAYHVSSTTRSSSSYSSRTHSYAPYAMSNYYSRYERDIQASHQRVYAPSTRQRPFRELQGLRERIGRRRSGPTSNGGGLSTADLPNRQQQQKQLHHNDNGSDSDSGNNDTGNKQGEHSIVITKPVYRNDSSSPPSASTSVSGHRKSSQVDPTSIVITKAVKQQSSSSSSSSPPPSTTSTTTIDNDQQVQHESSVSMSSPPPMNGDADRLLFQRYIEEQRQEQQQMRQQIEKQMQEQLKTQNEQILELQRLLSNQRMATDLTAHRQHGGGGLLANNGHPSSSTSNTVLLSNLDPMATSNDIEIVCGGFGIVVRCDVMRDTQGRSCGEAEVEFLDHDSALNCIAKFDNELVDDRVIRATLRPHPMQHTMRSVIAPTRSGYRTTSQVLYTDKRH